MGYILSFGSESRGWKELGRAPTIGDLHCPMMAYIKITFPGFKMYYLRGWLNDEGEQIMDFGSHTYFFKITPIREGEN